MTETNPQDQTDNLTQTLSPREKLKVFGNPGPHTGKLCFRSYYCIYYPANIIDSNKSYSPIIWANGTFGFPLAYHFLLRHLASWGYVVIASWSPFTFFDQSLMNGGMKIAEKLNDQDPLFKDKLNLDNTGACGHSQGGAVALLLSRQEKVKATVALQPAAVSCEKSKHPLLMITGGWDILVWPWLVHKVSFQTAKVLAFFLRHSTATHLMPLLTGRHLRAPTTAFFQWHLKKDSDAEQCFNDDQELARYNERWRFENNKSNLD